MRLAKTLSYINSKDWKTQVKLKLPRIPIGSHVLVEDTLVDNYRKIYYNKNEYLVDNNMINILLEFIDNDDE